MSLTGPGLAASRRGQVPADAWSGRRVRRRRWPAVTAFAIALVVMAAVVLVAWAARYQPLGYGDTGVSDLDYPGLPAAAGGKDGQHVRPCPPGRLYPRAARGPHLLPVR